MYLSANEIRATILTVVMLIGVWKWRFNHPVRVISLLAFSLLVLPGIGWGPALPYLAFNVSAIQGAINGANAAGGGRVLNLLGGQITAPIIMKTGVTLECASSNQIIQLAPNVNSDVVQGYQAYTLFGGNSAGGITEWSIRNCTFDGNYTNQSVAAFNASTSGSSTTLTVATMYYGKIQVGQTLTDHAGGISTTVTITGQTSGTTGAAGNYTISSAQNI